MLLIYATHCETDNLWANTGLKADDECSGGMGLTGGLVDVGDLFDCLVGIHDGRADTDILDMYNDIRRKKYEEFVNPISTANLRRMASDPEVIEASDEGLEAMREADKTDEAAIAFQLVSLEYFHVLSRFLLWPNKRAGNFGFVWRHDSVL